MKMRSISRRLIAMVLLLELLAALALVGLAVLHESQVRYRSFDVMLRGRADMMFGAIGDAEDPADNVMLDTRGLVIPPTDLYTVEEDTGRILGRSSDWPAQEIQSARQDRGGFLRLRLNGLHYRFVRHEGVRVVDPGDKNGGVSHRITVLYGSPTDHVWREVREAASFYAIASVLLLTLTGGAMAWFLRKGLAPLHELAEEAGRVSAQQWQFAPPESAQRTRELSPLTRAIEAALQRLQQSFEQQRRFTSDAAHELKTDVAIVKSSIQLLAMRPRSTDEYRQGLEVCMTDCERLENTVQEMLTLAGVEYASRQKGVAQPKSSNLAEYVQEAIVRLTPIAQLREVYLTFVAKGETTVALDGKECTLLCSNLLLNAIQHSHRDSEVQIELAGDEKYVTMTVQDFGEGIGPEVLPHVFEPFFRGDESRARKSGGTGLGLAICKAICDKAGAKIEILSTVGAGTRVVLRLPRG
jgi:signal transduction histidine kinase